MISRRQMIFMMGGGVAATALWGIHRFLPAEFSNTLRPTYPLMRYSDAELKRLKICFHDPVDPSGFFDPKRIFVPIMRALYEGMKRSGCNVFWGRFDEPANCDLAVIGGWRQKKVILAHQAAMKNILVIEQGNIQPRLEWPSLGFNGLVGYAHYAPTPDDGGERFLTNFGHHLQPWKYKQDGYALLIGQMPMDLSLHGLNMYQWLQEVTTKLLSMGHRVMYRPHPFLSDLTRRRRGRLFIPRGAELSHGLLGQNLAEANFSVAYSSTAAVESVLSGTSTVAMSKGCAAWDASSHSLSDPYYYPDRMIWCNDLAWRQWTLRELASGDAWDHTRRALLA